MHIANFWPFNLDSSIDFSLWNMSLYLYHHHSILQHERLQWPPPFCPTEIIILLGPKVFTDTLSHDYMCYSEHYSQLDHITYYKAVSFYFPGENNCLIRAFALYLLIHSKMGKCHLNTFKLTQYSINLVLVTSSVPQLLDLCSEEWPQGLTCHCFPGGSPLPSSWGLPSPGFSTGAPPPGFLDCLIWVVPTHQGAS